MSSMHVSCQLNCGSFIDLVVREELGCSSSAKLARSRRLMLPPDSLWYESYRRNGKPFSPLVIRTDVKRTLGSGSSLAKLRSDVDACGDRYSGRGKDKFMGEDSVESFFSAFDDITSSSANVDRGDGVPLVSRANFLGTSNGNLTGNLLLFLLWWSW